MLYRGENHSLKIICLFIFDFLLTPLLKKMATSSEILPLDCDEVKVAKSSAETKFSKDVTTTDIDSQMVPEFIIFEGFNKQVQYQISYANAIKKSWYIRQLYDKQWSSPTTNVIFVPGDTPTMNNLCNYFYENKDVSVKALPRQVRDHLMLEWDVEETKRKFQEERELLFEKMISESGFSKKTYQELTRIDDKVYKIFKPEFKFAVNYYYFGFRSLDVEDRPIFGEVLARNLESTMKEFKLDGAVVVNCQVNGVDCEINFNHTSVDYWYKTFIKAHEVHKLEERNKRELEQKQYTIEKNLSLTVTSSFENQLFDRANQLLNGVLFNSCFNLEICDTKQSESKLQQQQQQSSHDSDSNSGDDNDDDNDNNSNNSDDDDDDKQPSPKRQSFIFARELEKMFSVTPESKRRLQEILEESVLLGMSCIFQDDPDLSHRVFEASLRFEFIYEELLSVRIRCIDKRVVANIQNYCELLKIAKNLNDYCGNSTGVLSYTEKNIQQYLTSNRIELLEQICLNRYKRRVKAKFNRRELQITVFDESIKLQRHSVEQHQADNVENLDKDYYI